jgi:hypothetical protein
MPVGGVGEERQVSVEELRASESLVTGEAERRLRLVLDGIGRDW